MNTKWPQRTLAPLMAGTLLLAPFPSAAHSAKPDSAATSELPAKERRHIKAFLIDRFRAKGISRDLVAIIMKRVDAFAEGRRVPDAEQEYLKTKTYPSASLRIEWQSKLKEIAGEFRVEFNALLLQRSHEPIIFAGEPPSEPEILNFTAKAIEEAQGRH